MKLSKLFSVASLLTLVACAAAPHSSPTNSTISASSSSAAAQQSKADENTSLIGGEKWSMRLENSEFWLKTQSPEDPSDDVKTEFLAMSKDKSFDGFPVLLQVLSTHHGVSDVEFIKSVLTAQLETEGVKILKVKGAKTVSGENCALVLLTKNVDDTRVIILQLITSRDGDGFVVACGGGASGIDEFGPMCFGVMKTFEVKHEKSSSKKPAKIPTSTQQSTQTFNDTSF